MKVTIYQPWRGTPNGQSVEVEIPALPRQGDHLGHDQSGVIGYVDNVMFWWPEDGGPCQVEVRLVAVPRESRSQP